QSSPIKNYKTKMNCLIASSFLQMIFVFLIQIHPMIFVHPNTFGIQGTNYLNTILLDGYYAPIHQYFPFLILPKFFEKLDLLLHLNQNFHERGYNQILL